MKTNNLPDSAGFAEHRLCHQSGIDKLAKMLPSDPNEKLKSEAELVSGTGILGKAFRKACELDPGCEKRKDVLKNFADERKWREAFLSETIYTTDAVPPPAAAPGAPRGDIDTPTAFLMALPKNERGRYLKEYIREHFPKFTASADPQWSAINKDDAYYAGLDADGAAALLPNIRAIVYMDERTNNVAPTAVVNPAGDSLLPARVTVDDLDALAAVESKERFRTPAALIRAFDEAADRHPDWVVPGMTVADLKLKLQSDTGSFLSGALQLGAIDDTTVKKLIENYPSRKAEKMNTVREAAKGQQTVRQQVDELKARGMCELLRDNFNNLPPWGKFLALTAGVVAGWKFINWKTEKLPARVAKWGTLGVMAYYFLGGNKLVKDTWIESGMGKLEEGMKYMDKKVGGAILPSAPELNEAQLNIYATFFSETAGEKLGAEIESMSYLSTLPLGDIAENFTLSDDARGGLMNLGSSGKLENAIIKKFGEDVGATVIGKMRNQNVLLGNGMSHVFYLLGAMKNLEQHNKILKYMKDHKVKSFDAIPDAAPERRIYRELAARGRGIAMTDYRETNWLKTLQSLLRLPKP